LPPARRASLRPIAIACLRLVTLLPAGEISTKEANRVKEAAAVLQEIHAVPDKDIPQELWEKAECVIVVPGLKKAAFVIGGEYGNGLMSCRHSGEWSAPVFMQLGKGSWGLQIGAQSIDLVLLVMNASGVEKMLRNKVTLGAEASVAGVNLSGGVVKPDIDDNADLYGPNVAARDVVMGTTVTAPAVTEPFMKALRREK
jgi:lipid-binding SYLF domain-containing protein